MTENRLIDDISEALREMGSGRVLSPEEAKAFVSKIADAYDMDLQSISPWEKQEGVAYPYNDPSEWGLLLSSILGVFTGDVYLVVSNDSPFPWPVIVLSVDDVQTLLLELPHFEFFVFDDEGERVVFDTHYNELIIVEKP